jgi:ElaB/YqjD/DUF883 family membrane-anchored ribosome-binding protein
MASTPEVRKTGTPTAETHRQEKPQTLGEQMQHVGTQARETVQDMGAYVKETAQDMGTQARETVQGMGAYVKETVQDMGTQAKETVQTVGTQVYEQGQKSLQELNQTLEAQIRERPLQALLVAGGIGVLLGLLWRRS